MEEQKRAPGPDEMYCPGCGTLIKRNVEICADCGERVQEAAVSMRKDKVAAILLAVFLGFWTWLYTYKKDAWKFWVGLALTFTVFNPLWTWLILFVPNVGIWIWAIVDVSVKPRQFYEQY